MKMQVTKQWKEIPYKIMTIKFPIIPGIIVCSSQTEPKSDDGILNTKGEDKYYSDQKLWVKIPDYSSATSIEVNVQNFI